MSTERGGIAECGVRRAAGRCLRSRPMSAECGVRIVRSADCRLDLQGRPISAERGPRTAEYCGPITHADYGVLLFNSAGSSI